MSASSLLEQRPKGQGTKVQNGSVHQKDGLNDDDIEPYLSPQARPAPISTLKLCLEDCKKEVQILKHAESQKTLQLLISCEE
ncbi:UNVERIFIED_CONTAM: hypothetical protein K2H54_053288 [Gekko kuhli]